MVSSFASCLKRDRWQYRCRVTGAPGFKIRWVVLLDRLTVFPAQVDSMLPLFSRSL